MSAFRITSTPRDGPSALTRLPFLRLIVGDGRPQRLAAVLGPFLIRVAQQHQRQEPQQHLQADLFAVTQPLLQHGHQLGLMAQCNRAQATQAESQRLQPDIHLFRVEIAEIAPLQETAITPVLAQAGLVLDGRCCWRAADAEQQV